MTNQQLERIRARINRLESQRNELLAALRAMVSDHDFCLLGLRDSGNSLVEPASVRDARAAIAKAVQP